MDELGTAVAGGGERARILVVDDEAPVLESLRLALGREYDLKSARSGREALALLDDHEPELVLLDVMMPGTDGIAVLEQLKQRRPDLAVVMVTAVTAVKTVVEAMRRGAFDYIAKPFDLADLKLTIARALERRALGAEVQRLRSELANRYGFDRMIGRSPAMRAIYQVIEQVTDRRTTVLIHGESGTGKELIARAIHFSGARRHHRFEVVNCAAIPVDLLESQLFGHKKGAFTDARESRRGQFLLAHGGTLLLDEVGEMPLGMQSKLLRVLQEREIHPIGASKPLRVDVRIVAATNRDLEAATRSGEFRKDLYYRLNVVPILVPPLRARREDIPALVERFLADEFGSARPPEVAPAAMEMLCAHSWPGNVRELENVVQRLVALGPEKVIEPEHLPSDVRDGSRGQRLRDDVLDGRLNFPDAVRALETDLIRAALFRCAGVQSDAARLLGVSRRVLKYKMDKYGIDPESR